MAQGLERETYNRVVAGSNPAEAVWKLWQFALCLPWSVQANCTNVAAARLMSKLLTMNSGYRGWYRANCIAVWYARQAIPKRSLRYI